MGGKKKTTQTQTYTPPKWVESGAKQALNLGQRIGSQQYTPYTGERVAGLSTNEQMGMELARKSSGAYQPYFDQAQDYIQRGTQSFTDADMQAYMNPYIKAALDPTARELRQEGARALQGIDSRSASIDAMGGSRGALMRSEALEKTNQSISDLYKTGMSDAFDRATQLWGADRAREMMAGGQIMQLGQAVQRANTADINTLMNTGAVDRSIQQALNDFDYQQFTENRDWDIRNLGGLLMALEGTKGSYSTTQTSTTEQKGDPLGQALGLAATVFGAIYNPAGTAAGLASGAAQDFSGGGIGGLNIPSVDQVAPGDTYNLLGLGD